MRKIVVALSLIAIFAVSLGAQDMAVATVRLNRTEPIFKSKLDETVAALEQGQGRSLTIEEKREILDQMIDQKLVVQAAEADRTVTVTDEAVLQAGMQIVSQQLQSVGAIPPGAVLTDRMQFRQVIEQQGGDYDEFLKTVRGQLLAEKYITTVRQSDFQSIGQATQRELEAEYQRRINEFVISDSIWFDQIFFQTHQRSPEEARAKAERAREVHRLLMNTNATFADLVASDSDDEVSKARGGRVGPVMKGDESMEQIYGEEFMEKLFEMDIDEVSDVLRSNVGYHIIKMKEKRSAQLLPMDEPEVKAYLEQIIYARKYQAKFEEITREIVDSLREQATVVYTGEYR
jgi:parvulin-like peptidyl-prolyl isomerase